MFEDIFKCIEANDTITIFRHIRPDGDAYGSQFGLASYIRYRYPEKKVYCVGSNEGRNSGLFPKADVVTDELIASSLAISVDTSTKERVDDQRMFLAKVTCKIDHHDSSEPYADYEVVMPHQASCAEVIVKMISEVEDASKIPQETATYLYSGIISDTQDFSITSASYESLYLASLLAKTGISLSSIHYLVNRQTSAVFRLTSAFRNRMQFTDNHIGYAYCDKALMDEFGVEYNDCKDLVNQFGIISDVEIWVLFIEDYMDHPGQFNASLRSRGAIVNEIASHHGGGGHKQAAGTKAMPLEETKVLLEECDKEVTRYMNSL